MPGKFRSVSMNVAVGRRRGCTIYGGPRETLAETVPEVHAFRVTGIPET